jgi:hypothetical protein
MMTQGSKIPPEVHHIVIQLSSIIKPDDIAIYTGILPWAIQHILCFFAMHGAVEGKKDHKMRDGNLHDTDLQVSSSVIIITIVV